MESRMAMQSKLIVLGMLAAAGVWSCAAHRGPESRLGPNTFDVLGHHKRISCEEEASVPGEAESSCKVKTHYKNDGVTLESVELLPGEREKGCTLVKSPHLSVDHAEVTNTTGLLSFIQQPAPVPQATLATTTRLCCTYYATTPPILICRSC